MPSLKDYNRKINSLLNTSKITKTMKMVSASKLRNAQEAQRDASLFNQEVNRLIYRLMSRLEAEEHPLIRPRYTIKNVLFIVFTSDRGLCGGFNNNLIRFTDKERIERENTGIEVGIGCCGKRGYTYFRKHAYIQKHYEEITEKPSPLEAHDLANELCREFLDGKQDEVYLLYNEFINPLTQNPQMIRLLPVEAEELTLEEKEDISEDYIVEPNINFLLEKLLMRTIDFRIYYALLENAAGEHGARMTAMDNATNNASQLIQTNRLLRNRARQAAITTELIEIISGAESL